MKEELERKAAELEKALLTQVQVARKESEDWVKIAGVALVSGIVAYGIVKILGNSKEKKKTKKVMAALEKEGLLDNDIKKKLTQKPEPGLLGRLGVALLQIAINFGKEQLLNRLQEHSGNVDEAQK